MQKRWFWKTLFLVLTICLLTLMAGALADVGNSFSSGGGSSSGGSSYDSGSSYSSYSNKSNKNSYSSNAYLYFDSSRSSAGGSVSSGAPIALAVVMGLFCYIMAKIRSDSSVRYVGDRPDAAISIPLNKRHPPPYEDNANAISRMQADDPHFSVTAFKAEVRRVFLRVQRAWASHNWESARSIQTPELFEKHAIQLQEHINKGWFNRMEGQEILSVLIANYKVEGNYAAITVRLLASVKDYVVDAAGQLISGNVDARYDRVYRLVFRREIDAQNMVSQANTNCPNCGAPLSEVRFCPHCGTKVKQGAWLLDHYGAW